MTTLAPNLPPLPARFIGLPVDHRGFPVPKFVAFINGEWDFRVIKPGYVEECVRRKICWLCGQPLGRWKAFVIGPMCALNRTTAEPPSHLECARFACQACPFLAFPNRKRDGRDMPEGARPPAGTMIARNPGVTCLWITETFRRWRASNGVLIEIGEAVNVEWWAHGRTATRAEIMASIDTGYPLLMEMAQRDGAEAVAELEQMKVEAMALVPA
jgi:hypothetical protein